ncbi:MAG: hypothetical protein OEU32_12805 [Acidimicrobiia bacterium]|nr:hypothetical protein [Acidimicrobiia bacterium]
MAGFGWFFSQGEVAVTDMESGLCFNWEDPNAFELDKVNKAECGEPHDAYVYAVFAAGGEYATIEATADDGCFGRVPLELAEAYGIETLTYNFVYPTSEGWNAGDKDVICVFESFDGSKIQRAAA